MGSIDSSAEFLRRAAAEAARYGEDPTVFLRELGQNARDANATRIQVSLRVEGDRAWLIFSDDGRGMSLEHAKAYLFRLYASSKEEDTASAGRFGVGFWSVLRWSPERIEVHSRSRDQAWGVGLAGDLKSWERLACRRKSRGTSIVLVRPETAGTDEVLRGEIHRGLVRYLAHLRTAGLRPRPLPVRFDGRRIERPFQLQGPGALRFSEGPLEGVVGFGPQPSYRLFARGLPVSEGVFLDELEGQPGQVQKVEREGVAPVYLLNGNNLEVVLSRQTVVRDRALRELIRVARTRFEELVARTIDGAVSQSFGQRLLSLAAKLARAFGRAPTWLRVTGIVVALLLLGGAIGLTAAWLGHADNSGQAGTGLKIVRADPASTLAPNDGPRATDGSLARRATGAPTLGVRPEKPRFFGARGSGTDPLRSPVHRPGDWAGVRTGTVVADAGDAGWAFRYRPGLDLMFRRSLLTRYDRELGFQAALEKGPWRRPARAAAQPDSQVEIELRMDGAGGWYILPVPTGYDPQRASCRFGDGGLLLQVNPQGLVRVRVPSGLPGTLRYRVVPAPEPGPALIAGMKPPPRRLPDLIERRLEALGTEPMSERIAAATLLVQDLLAYDRSAATAELYRQRMGQGREWAAEVVDIGAGDCDVINGLAVLVLHRLGVPARMVAGMVGRGGSAQAGWHAWIEIVQQGRLEVLDVSMGAQKLHRPDQPDGAAPATPDPGPQGRARAGAPARGPASVSGPRPAWSAELQTVGLVLIGFALAMVALFAFYALGRRGQLAVSTDDERRRDLLAGMAADALRRPKAWKDVQGIWHRGFLPCVGKKTISLARLVKLSRAERAFVGKSGGELVGEALHSGLVVLAADDPHFGPLYSRTANLRDLDELARNKPLARPRGFAGRLLSDLNRLVGRAGVRIACRAVRTDGSGRPFWDVDLRPIRPRRRSGWPRRFVAVDLEHPWWRSVEALYRRNPALAVCVAIDRLASGAALLAERSEPLRRAAARRALRGGALQDGQAAG